MQGFSDHNRNLILGLSLVAVEEMPLFLKRRILFFCPISMVQ